MSGGVHLHGLEPGQHGGGELLATFSPILPARESNPIFQIGKNNLYFLNIFILAIIICIF